MSKEAISKNVYQHNCIWISRSCTTNQ